MASSSRTTNPLIAGVGAFVVVIGGLAIYKRYTAKTSAPHSADIANNGITAPDPEAVEPTADVATVGRTVTPQHFISVDLARAFRMVGRSNEDLLAEFGSEIFVTGDDSIKWQRFAELDGSSYFLPFALTDSGDYNAEIGFYSDAEGKITRLVALTGGSETKLDNGTLATALIGQADWTWQPATLERSVENGLALRYTTDNLRIIATHELTNDQWRFDIRPTKADVDLLGGLGTIGTGKYVTANCDVVGRAPAHLGNGRFFTIGQSQQAAVAVANRVDPENSFDADDGMGMLSLDAGIPGLTLMVQTRADKVQSLTYFDHLAEQLSEPRRDEFAACWNKRVTLVDGVSYWQTGGERYRLDYEELHIARTESLQRVVQRLAAGIGKANTGLADLEAATFIANTPDWPVTTNLFLDDDTAYVTTIETTVGFDGKPARRAQLLQEIEFGIGTGKLIRNAAGVPILRISTRQATVDVQPANSTEMSIMFSQPNVAER